MWNDLCDELLNETDIAYEEEIGRNPYSINVWVAYIESLKKAPANVRYLNYERALKVMPACYKIWNLYLAERRKAIKNVCVTDPAYEACNLLHERALVYCSRMPRLWLDFLELLVKEKKITATRRTIDAALKALPITQHYRIWDLAIQWLAKETQGGSGDALIPEETALCLFRRYVMLQPDHIETYVAYLLSRKRYDESAVRMTEIVNDDEFVSIEGKTSHQLWMDLCDIISRHPAEIKSVKIEPIIRNGLMKFSDEVGRLWNALADHYVRLGFFEKARDIYEEGIDKVQTVHDFSLIWEAYTKFMESWLLAMMEKQHKDLELLLARNEQLMDRRPEILSSVLLRQNPHNVHQWLERTKLPCYVDKPEKVVETFVEAVCTIDPQQAVGKLNVLHTQFAAFYEKYGAFDNARAIFQKAVEVNFRAVDDLASVWCEWVEFELRHQEYNKALEVARQSVNLHATKGTVQYRLSRSVKLWALVADLEESFGTHESTKATYDRMFELRVITPQIIINYAHYLEEIHWYEESFKAFERGVKLFKRPHVNDLWVFYLTKFVDRYGGRKLERARDLFEEAVIGTEGDVAVSIYCLYARLEEDFGMARHALSIYDRLTKACGTAHLYDIFCVLIAKTQEFFGATKSREVYERAIEALPEGPKLVQMCMKYSSTEAALGEVDRARAIFQHSSQFCDPNKEKLDFWRTWRMFEVQYGNEDTFRDMLRIKRSVDAQYAQVHFNTENIAQAKVAREQMDPLQQAEREMAVKGTKDQDPMAALETVTEVDTREASVTFAPCHAYIGSRLGYVFKLGVQGLGYYEDLHPQSKAQAAKPKKASNSEDLWGDDVEF